MKTEADKQRELSRRAADKALELEAKKRGQRIWDNTYSATFSALAADAFLKANTPDEFTESMQRKTVRNLLGNASVLAAQASCEYFDDLQQRLGETITEREEATSTSCKVCVDSKVQKGVCIKCGRSWE